MKIIFTFILFSLISPIIQAEGTQAELEVRQRDVVIGEMAEIIFQFSKSYTQEQLANYLRTIQKATAAPGIVSIEGNYVFWGTTVKFEYNNGVLANVYW